MAICIWRGDAQGIAQVSRVTVSNIEDGDIFTLTVNRKDISFTATLASEENVYQGLAAAIQAANIPEFPTAVYVPAESGIEAYLKLTGLADGTPFSISGTADNGGVGELDVFVLQQGGGGRNMQQLVSIPPGTDAGSFKLSFEGQTTDDLGTTSFASVIESELESLSTIGSGNVSVSGDAGGPWLVEFTGALAEQNQTMLLGDGSNLIGQSVSVVTTANGTPGLNHKIKVTGTQSLDSELPVAFYFENPGIPGSAAGSITTAYPSLFPSQIAAIYNVASNEVLVNYAVTETLVSRVHTITYEIVGSKAGQALPAADVSLSTISPETDHDAIVSREVISLGGDTVDESQLITFPSQPTGGTFTLSFQTYVTSPLAYNISASAMQSALEGLASIGPGNVSVTDASPSGWQVTFQGALAATDLPNLVGVGSLLTGGLVPVSEYQSAVAAVNEKVYLSVGDNVTGGTYTLTFGGNTTGNIAYNATAGTVQSALQSLTSIGSGNASVTGVPGGPYEISFIGSLAGTNVGPITADGSNLVGSSSETISITSITSPTGPYHWDEAENWSGGNVPANSDTVVFEDNSNPVKYGLNQSAVTLALLDIRASYTGEIGLPNVNEDGVTPYIEYRDKHLKIGATSVKIGDGEGNGSERIRIDLGSVQSTITVYSTASPPATGEYAVTLLGTHASNKLYVYQGVVSVAQYSGESAVIDELYVGFDGDQASDVELFLGDDVTLGDVVIHGGQVTNQGLAGSAITSLLVSAGEVYLHGTDGVSQLDIEGGEVYYRSTGTLGGNTIVGGEGTLSFAGDLRAKTVTNAITVRGDAANVVDSQSVVSSLAVVYQSTTRLPEMGTNFTLTRS